jgi:hypothetical protein
LAWYASRSIAPERAFVPVLVCGVAMVAAMGAMYPVSAIDLFIYAVRSRLFTAHGVDPIAVAPIAFPDDPLMRFASAEWADDVSPYGPLWNLIAAPATWLAGDRIAIALAAFKVLAGLSILVGAWLISRIVARDRPRDATTAALVYLWNPLVLWEGAGNGHNDVVLVLPLLLAILAWQTRRDRWVIPLLVVAALIKYVTLLLIPLAVAAFWRRGQSARRRGEVLASAAAFSMAAVIAGSTPFYDLSAIRNSVEKQSDIFLTSPAAVAVDLLDRILALGSAMAAVKLVGLAIFAVTLIWWLDRIRRRSSDLTEAVSEVLFVYLLVASWQFRSWYLIWLVALAAVAGRRWLRVRVLVWTVGAMAAYALFIWGWHWWPVDFATIQRLAVLLMFGPVMLATLVGLAVREEQ